MPTVYSGPLLMVSFLLVWFPTAGANPFQEEPGRLIAPPVLPVGPPRWASTSIKPHQKGRI